MRGAAPRGETLMVSPLTLGYFWQKEEGGQPVFLFAPNIPAGGIKSLWVGRQNRCPALDGAGDSA